MMSNTIRLSGSTCRALTLTAFFGAASLFAGAQTSTSKPITPLDLSASEAAYSSSQQQFTDSAPDNEVAVANNHFNFLGAMNAMQYGGRRTSGRPRYRGGNTNEDGSKKYEFYFGAGFTLPTGPTHHVDTTSWGFQVGAGRNFNKHVGVNVEFNWDNFGLKGSTLNNQENLYNNYITLYNQYCVSNPSDPGCVANGGAIDPLSGLDGYSHVWSLGLEPVYKIAVNEGLGAYLEGGFGFYHKITTFTVPSVGYECDPYYGDCYEYAANTPIDSYTSNAPGVNVGIGFTYKFSRFSSERLYADIRYVYVFNQYRPGVDASTCTTLSCASDTAALFNDYPANSQHTSYIPVKFGIRF